MSKRIPSEWSWLIAFALGVATLRQLVATTAPPPDCASGVCPLPTPPAATGTAR